MSEQILKYTCMNHRMMKFVHELKTWTKYTLIYCCECVTYGSGQNTLDVWIIWFTIAQLFSISFINGNDNGEVSLQCTLWKVNRDLIQLTTRYFSLLLSLSLNSAVYRFSRRNVFVIDWLQADKESFTMQNICRIYVNRKN